MANTKVTSAVIADDAITSAKIDSTSTGMTFADLTVDTSTLVVDATNNRVGIGTSSPSTPLHVKTNASGYALTIEENSGGEAYQIGTDSFGGLVFFNSGTKVADFADSSEFQVYASGAVKAKISPTGNSYFNGGNVGIGTSSPTTNSGFGTPLLEVRGSSGGSLLSTNSTTSGEGVFTTRDTGINISMAGSATASTGNNIIFRTGNTNSNYNSTERMRIDSSGYLIVGTSSSYTSAFVQAYSSAANTSVYNSWNAATSGTRFHFEFRDGASATSRGNITTNGSNTTYNTSSDARLKDVTGEARGLEVINSLNPVSYNWKESGIADEGLLAQEVMEIVPNAIVEDSSGYYSMDYSKLVTHLVAGMKEQQVLIEQLQAEVALLKGE